MNTAQKFYDSAFTTISGSQKLNPFFYFKSLQLIGSRKTQYPSFDRFIIKREPQLPYKNHFVIEANKKYNQKISIMRQKPVIPKINSLFLELDQRIKHNKEKIKENKTRALTLENSKYNTRVRNQKPKLLKAEFLKKLFVENHDKYLEILLRNTRFRKKVGKSNNKNTYIKLPSISGYKDGIFSNRLHSKTEYNLDDDIENSNDNSVEQRDHKHIEISHQKRGNNY